VQQPEGQKRFCDSFKGYGGLSQVLFWFGGGIAKPAVERPIYRALWNDSIGLISVNLHLSNSFE